MPTHIDKQATDITQNSELEVPQSEKTKFALISTSLALFSTITASSQLLKMFDIETGLQVLDRHILPILRNHGTDMGTTTIITSLCMAIAYSKAVDKEKNGLNTDKMPKFIKWITKNENNSMTATALFGMATSLLLGFEEYSRLFLQLDPELCQKLIDTHKVWTSSSCRGDFGDIAVFGVPFIAGSIYLAKNIFKKSQI